MATLAASFLADFDEPDEEELQQQIDASQQKQAQVKTEPQEKEEEPSEDEAEEQKTGDGAAAGMDVDDADDDDDDEKQTEADAKAFESGSEEEHTPPACAARSGLRPRSERLKLTRATLHLPPRSMSQLPEAPLDPIMPIFTPSTPLASITSLLHSNKLQRHLTTIDEFQHASNAAEAAAATNTTAASSTGATALALPAINKEAEYPYIVYSNELAVEIDAHIAGLHKLARDLYAPRYSELEQLLSNPIEYARVASLIGNETDMSRIGKLLAGTGIANNILLTISVTATTTRGKPLPEEDLTKLRAVCQTILDLDAVKARLHSYIASRMAVVAPNVTAMLGAELAARLVALAGGVKKLAEIPACNLQVLGKRGKQQSGLSRIAQGAHEGLIVHSAVLQSTPAALRTRALRLLANKLALATRLDGFDDTTDDSTGRSLLEEIRAKIDKWQEPPEAKLVKALPIPLQRSKPKRGGRRHRKQRELMALTEVAKQKSRLAFGKAAVVDEYTGEDMGMIGADGSGVLRITNKETKLAKRLSQKTQARLKRVGAGAAGMAAAAAAAASGVGTGVITSISALNGTASSIAFTAHQGMQLVPTEQVQRLGGKAAGAAAYFDNATSFAKVKQPSSTSTNAAAKRALPPVPAFGAPAVTAQEPPSKRPKL